MLIFREGKSFSAFSSRSFTFSKILSIFLALAGSFKGIDGFELSQYLHFKQARKIGNNLKMSENKADESCNYENEKIFLVTGSTDGIGKHTSQKLAETGARVIIHGRNPTRCEETVAWLQSTTGNDKIDHFVADLSEMRNVKALAEQISQTYPHLDCLINNAGVFEEDFQVTPDGMEMTFAVNVAAPFVLTQRLLPLLQKKPGSRLIVVSSISQGWSIDMENLQYQNGGFSAHSSYSLSKLCDAMIAFEMAERFGSESLTVNTLDPGTVNTKMLQAGWGMCGISVSRANNEFWLATSPDVAGVNGKYFVSCRETSASQVAYDKEVRQQLWEYLENITGVSF